jgi:hypothetical protein
MSVGNVWLFLNTHYRGHVCRSSGHDKINQRASCYYDGFIFRLLGFCGNTLP